MRAAVVLCLTVYVLQALVGQANTALSGLHVSLFAGGLFVTYAALVLAPGPALLVAVTGGLLCDAPAPVPFGTHALLFALATLFVCRGRDRLAREDTGARTLVALGINLALFALLSSLAFRRGLPRSLAWSRLALDLAWSQLAVGLAAPWFFALQARTLALARAEVPD